MPYRLYTISTLRQSRERRLAHPHPPERLVPFLRLRGRWLEELGFERGGKVRLEAEPGRLVLTLASGEEG